MPGASKQQCEGDHMTMHPNIKAAIFPAAFFAAFLWAQADDHGHEFDQAAALEAAQQEEAAKASRDWVASQVCQGNGHGEWIDDKTIRCTTSSGRRSVLVAAGTKP